MSDGYRSDAEKDPRELEREVEQQRAEVQDSLNALVERFMPERMLERALDSLRHGGGGDLTRGLVETVRANPVPAALTATGLVWMLLAGQKPRQASSGRSHRGAQSATAGFTGGADYSDELSPSSASYGVDPVYDPHAGEGHHELGADESHHRGARLRHVSDKTRRMASQSREAASSGFESLMQRQPLALGVIGLALGVIVGAAIPISRRESEMLGPQRDRLARKASQFAEQAAVKVDEVGRHISEGAKQQSGKTTH